VHLDQPEAKVLIQSARKSQPALAGDLARRGENDSSSVSSCFKVAAYVPVEIALRVLGHRRNEEESRPVW
jgi:hypothetical protein